MGGLSISNPEAAKLETKIVNSPEYRKGMAYGMIAATAFTIDVFAFYTTVDNTRLLAARRTGIEVRANAHNYDDLIPEDMAVRFANKKGELPTTWGEAIENRIKNQNSTFKSNYESGSFVEPKSK